MLANKLFQLLTRRGVQELVLQVGHPPRALLSNTHKDLSAQLLCEDDIVSVLTAAGGREQLARLAHGSAAWECQVDSVGRVGVSAGYQGVHLRAALRLVTSAAAVAAVKERSVAAQPAPRAAAAYPAPEPVLPAQPARRDRTTASEARAAAVELPELLEPPEWALTAAAPAPAPVPALAPAPEPTDDAPSETFGAAETPAHAPTAVDLQRAFNYEPAPIWDGSGALAADRAREPAAKPAENRAPRARYAGDLLDDLLGMARELQASDVHVLADRPAAFRIAGELIAQGAVIARERAEQLVMARVPAGMREQLERQGSCDFSLIHPAYGRFRANVSRQRTGIKLTARLIGAAIPTLAELGLPESIARAVHHHQGLIVVTGPTGHGKTTTLAAIVDIINRETKHHVITVEDPIEYVHRPAKAVISQREVGTHTKSFQNALKGSLREDPDVIVVGELRDTETVRMAMTASETGHLVISTMNTPSAAKAIERLIDLFPPSDQPQVRMTLAGGLRLIISQRLLPTADRKQQCVAAEVLPGCLPLWNLIRDDRTFQIASLQQRGKSLGIVRLDDSLAELVKSGKTTLDIAREVAEAPEHFDALVAGRAQPAQKPNQPAASAAKDVPAAAAHADPAKSTLAGYPGRQAAPQQKSKELGKTVLARAGRLFNGDTK